MSVAEQQPGGANPSLRGTEAYPRAERVKLRLSAVARATTGASATSVRLRRAGGLIIRDTDAPAVPLYTPIRP